MLLNVKGEAGKKSDFILRVGAAIIAGFFLLTVLPIWDGWLGLSNLSAPEGTVRAIGKLVYTDYVYCFEVASILILIAVVGAVTLGRRARIPNIASE
jgi:NADH-quinone oxidoreductase subunit J